MKTLRWLKDYEDIKRGDIRDAGDKSAENFVSQGYAEYLEESQEKCNKNESKTNEDEQQISPTDLLKMNGNELELSKYEEGKINWIEDDFFDDWEKIKAHMKKIMYHNANYTYEEDVEDLKKIFLAHSRDKLVGKAQLASQTQIPLPLIKQRVTKEKIEVLDRAKGKNVKQDAYNCKYMMFDERVDARERGYQRDSFSQDFYLYHLVNEYDKAYWLFSQKKIPYGKCTFTGMIVEAEHLGELSKSFKLPTKSRVFFVKEFEPAVKILSKEKIVEFTKTREITREKWRDAIDEHPNGNYNRFVPDVNQLRDAIILSGKRDGYGLHVSIRGPPGTVKTKGHLETLDYKFNEISNILAGGNSRIKMLTPSFKEKPANLGYLAKVERVGFIDELGKMIEFELNKHQSISARNILGDCNLLYDNDEQIVGSGNDNEVRVKASGKFIDSLNPVNGKKTIYEHVGIEDATYMSRKLHWVQDKEEQDFIFSGKAVERVSPHTEKYTYIQKIGGEEEKKKNYTYISDSVGGIGNEGSTAVFSCREEFLTLFDTCNSFVCDINEERVRKLYDEVTFLAKEPMKSHVWKPRGDHHVFLLIDGLVKARCLFDDYDETFEPKEEDYQLAERILIRMVKGWDTNLSTKEAYL